MRKLVTNLLLTLMALAMLAALAVAIPSGSITQQAKDAYLDEGPSDIDDEYAFLFDE